MPLSECSEKKIERSQAVETVFQMVRDVMWRIQDCDWAEKQQEMTLKLFKFLWSAKSIEDIAVALVKIAIKKDEKAEDDSEDLDLYME